MLVRVVAVVALILVGGSFAAWQLSDRERARQEASGAAVQVSSGDLRAGDPLPAPAGEAVLRVRGVRDGNAGRVTALDVATIERLPQVRLTTYEPFRKADMTFQGVRFADLLRASGLPSGSASVYMHALDDYHVTLPLAQLAASGAVLATRSGGRAIAIDEGGPVRLVFPGGTRLGRNSDNWIWSLDWIRAAP